MPSPLGLVAAVLLLACPLPARAQPLMEVVFLGTNGPMPEVGRGGTTTAILVAGDLLLFDAGLNAAQQLVEAGISPARVRHVFLSHLHSDHIAGLPGVWSAGWLRRRDSPLHIYGPTGTDSIKSGLEALFSADIPIRLNGPEALPQGGEVIEASTIDQDGEIYNSKGVSITAFLVDHGEDAAPAYGFRIQYSGISVCLSGDTTYNTNLIENCLNTDLLVHEVMGVTDELLAAGRYRSGVLEVHATPEQAGQVFEETQPKLAAFTHIILAQQPGFAPMTREELTSRTRTKYAGPLLVPTELDRVSISATDIRYGNNIIAR